MSRSILVAVLALAGLPAAARPQEPGPEPEPTPVEVLRELQQGEDQGEDEMVRLFAEVETRLREVDRMLYDASAGRPIEGAEESGIDRLMRRSRETSKQVLEGIDEILQLALQRAQQQQQQQQQQQAGGQQQPDQQGESPLDQQRQDGQGERERTPEGQQQPGDPQQQQGERPEDGQEGGGDPRNQPGAAPPGGETGRGQPGDGNDRWGDLPVHVRELFRVQGGDDLPPRYRDWIDAYYRRLNERP